MPASLATDLRILFVCILLFNIMTIMSLRLKSETYDEDRHLEYGEKILKEHSTRRCPTGSDCRLERRFNSKMPVSVINALPGFIAEKIGLQLPPRTKLLINRLPTSLVFATLLFSTIFFWAKALYGRGAALLACFLCLFCPNLLAHSRFITTDMPLTATMFWACFCYDRYLRKPTNGSFFLAGISLGLAQLTKSTAIYLFPIYTISQAIHSFFLAGECRRRYGRQLIRDYWRLAGIFLLALLIINVTLFFEGSFTPLRDYQLKSQPFQRLAQIPLLRDIPLPVPYSFIEGLDWVTKGALNDRLSYLFGQLHRASGWEWCHYFSIALLLKVPVPVHLLLITTLVAITRRREWRMVWRREVIVIVPPLLLFIYFSFFFSHYIGLRYLLPIFPFLYLFLAREIRHMAIISRASLGLLCLCGSYLVSSLTIYPHYLAYFNILAGGPRQGYHYLERVAEFKFAKIRQAVDRYCSSACSFLVLLYCYLIYSKFHYQLSNS